MEPPAQKIWLAVIPAMIVPFLASLFYFVILDQQALAQYLYFGSKVFILIWPVIAAIFILGKPLAKFRLNSPHHLRALLAGIVSGLIIVLVMIVLLFTPVGTIVKEATPSIRGKAEDLGFADHFIALTVFLAFFHSLLEEYYWRWFVYGNLRQVLGLISGNIVAALSFAAHHIVVATQFFPFFWGLVLGLAVGIGGVVWNLHYEKQKTLTGAWISHMIVDLGIMSVGYALLFY